MSPPMHVLVPVDGSPFGRRGLSSVCRLLDAKRFHVTLLRVAPIPHDVTTPPPRPMILDGWSQLIENPTADSELAEYPVYASQIWESVRAELMDDMAPEMHCLREAGFEVALEVRFGSAGDEIIDRIADDDFDLVAMATHGRSGLQRALLGSVAERVVRHSTTPVLLTRPQPPDER